MISKYFKIEELVPKDTFEKYGDDCWKYFTDNSLRMLDGVREFFEKPVTVNNWLWGGNLQYRGYRPPDCPIGAPFSYHKSGRAFDFDVKGMSAEEVRRHILDNQDDLLLIWIERMEKDVSWVHVDTGSLPTGKGRIYLFKG